MGNTPFGPGSEQTISASSRECIYGCQTTNVMDIIVAQAPDAATAQADFAQEQAEAQATITSKLPPGTTAKLNSANTEGIGDKAVTTTGAASVEGQTISFTGIYVLSGATFFTIGDLVLAKAPPTVTSMQDQAKGTLGRV